MLFRSFTVVLAYLSSCFLIVIVVLEVVFWSLFQLTNVVGVDIWTGVTFVASVLDEFDAYFVFLGLSEVALWGWCRCVTT